MLNKWKTPKFIAASTDLADNKNDRKYSMVMTGLMAKEYFDFNIVYKN